MRRLNRQKVTGEDLFIGIDLHKARWHVTILGCRMANLSGVRTLACPLPEVR